MAADVLAGKKSDLHIRLDWLPPAAGGCPSFYPRLEDTKQVAVRIPVDAEAPLALSGKLRNIRPP